MNKNSAIMRLATRGLFLAACSSPAALAQSAPPSGTFYAGAHATYDKDSNLWDDVAVGYLGEHSSDGVHFGAQLGYDLDLGPLFVGAVATFRPNGVSGEHKDLQFSDNIPQYDRSDEKWNAQFAGRAGVSTAGFRLYGKTGLALSRKRYTIIGYLVENEVFSSKTTTRSGWLLGAGVERDLAPHIAVFIDYTHADYGYRTVNFSCPTADSACGPAGSSVIPIRLDDKTGNVSVGFNLRF